MGVQYSLGCGRYRVKMPRTSFHFVTTKKQHLKEGSGDGQDSVLFRSYGTSRTADISFCSHKQRVQETEVFPRCLNWTQYRPELGPSFKVFLLALPAGIDPLRYDTWAFHVRSLTCKVPVTS